MYITVQQMGHIGGLVRSVSSLHNALVHFFTRHTLVNCSDLEYDLKRNLEKVAEELKLPKERAGEIRLAHIRDGGREADIWDGMSPDSPSRRVSSTVYKGWY